VVLKELPNYPVVVIHTVTNGLADCCGLPWKRNPVERQGTVLWACTGCFGFRSAPTPPDALDGRCTCGGRWPCPDIDAPAYRSEAYAHHALATATPAPLDVALREVARERLYALPDGWRETMTVGDIVDAALGPRDESNRKVAR
jgi:hypothetical protein